MLCPEGPPGVQGRGLHNGAVGRVAGKYRSSGSRSRSYIPGTVAVAEAAAF